MHYNMEFSDPNASNVKKRQDRSISPEQHSISKVAEEKYSPVKAEFVPKKSLSMEGKIGISALGGCNRKREISAASSCTETTEYEPEELEEINRKLSMKDNSLEGLQQDITAQQITFPKKLMDLLENDDASDALWWLPEGDAFVIEPKVFADKILNKSFQGTKFESFIRKLNRWGFKRLVGKRVPPDAIAYCHTSFKKGSPHLLKNMSGRKKKDKNARRSIIASDELRRDLQQRCGPIYSHQYALGMAQRPSPFSFTPSVGSLGATGTAVSYPEALLQNQLDRDVLVQNMIEQQRLFDLESEIKQRQNILAAQALNQHEVLAQREAALVHRDVLAQKETMAQRDVLAQSEAMAQQREILARRKALEASIATATRTATASPSSSPMFLRTAYGELGSGMSLTLPSIYQSSAAAAATPLESLSVLRQQQEQAAARDGSFLQRYMMLEQQRQLEEQETMFRRGL